MRFRCKVYKQYVKDDFVLKQISEYVLKGKKPDKQERKTLTNEGMSYVNVFECLSFVDGILYFQDPEINGVLKPKRLCLPVSLHETAFNLSHADPTSGHYGINNTFRKMREKFYFPNLYQFVAARVLNCISCIKKRPNYNKAQHSQHREELSYFGQRVYTDIVGPLNGNKYGGKVCKYLLTIQDGFTRLLVAVPLPDQKTETVVSNLIDKWVLVHGVPEVIHSDNGSNYSSNLFKEVMARLGIIKTYTPSYSPAGNRVERSHRVLGEILRSDTRFGESNWVSKVPAALLAYNASVNRMTGLSPFEAVYGRAVKLPIDLIFPFERQSEQSWATHIECLKLKFSKLCEKMCTQQKSVISRDNARFQARSKPEFSVNDQVYYFMSHTKPGISKKLAKRWIGPFRIVKVVSESLVVLFPVGNWCQNPREIASIVNRLRKIDPSVTTPHNSIESGGERIDLQTLSHDLDEQAEYLSYQDEPEGSQDEPAMTQTESTDSESESRKEKEQFFDDELELEHTEVPDAPPPEEEPQSDQIPNERAEDHPPLAEKGRKQRSKRVWPRREGETLTRNAKGVAKIQLSQLFGRN